MVYVWRRSYFRWSIVLASLGLCACTEQMLSREDFGVRVASVSFFQLDQPTSNFRVVNATNLLPMQVLCSGSAITLLVSADGANWLTLGTAACQAPQLTDFTVDFADLLTRFSALGLSLAPPVLNLTIKGVLGDAETLPQSVRFLQVAVDPAQTVVQLGAGQTYATSLATTLLSQVAFRAGSSWQASPSEQFITSDSTCSSGATWTAFSVLTPLVWLDAYNQVNTKYVKFKDDLGNESECFSDTIIHDSLAPQITSVLINAGQATTNTSSATYNFATSSTDVANMALFNTATCSGTQTWTSVVLSGPLTLANVQEPIFAVRLRDHAGNISACVWDSIVYDNDPPSVPNTLSLLGGTQPLDNDTPIQIRIGGVLEGDTGRLFSDPSCTILLGTAVAGTQGADVTIALPSDGTYVFYADAIDPYGLASSCSSALLTYQLDRVAPQVTSVGSPSPNGNYTTGQTIPIHVVFSKPVMVTGSPQIVLDINGSPRPASYQAGSTSDTLVFHFVVGAQEQEDDLGYSTTAALELNGGTIQDALGNVGNLLLPANGSGASLSDQKNITLNFEVTITNIYHPSPAVYGTSDTLEFVTEWSHRVQATAPVLAANVGGQNVNSSFSLARSNLTEGLMRFLSAALTTQVDFDEANLTGITPTGSVQNIFSANANLTIPSAAATTSGLVVLGGTVPGYRFGNSITSHFVELAESAGATQINFQLSSAAMVDTTLWYDVIPGSATAGSDYTLPSGSVTVSAGATGGSIPITIHEDSTPEPMETLVIRLRDADFARPAATVNAATIEVYIADNDQAVSSTLADVVMGRAHICTLNSAGTVRCAGDNSSGQLGQGNTTAQTGFVTVPLPWPATQISAGRLQTCAVANSRLYCWGANDSGSFGLNNTTAQHSPTEVTALGTNVTEVRTSSIDSAGGVFVCTRVFESGLGYHQLRCAGENGSGQLGNNSLTNSSTFQTVSGISSNVQKFALSYAHACLTDGAGDLWCWGNNTSGQLGVGDFISPRITPSFVVSNPQASHLALFNNTSCLRNASSQVWCWGRAGENSLGNGTTINMSSYPGVSPNFALSAGQSVVSIDAGLSHACGLLSDQTFKCWGNNANLGQLLATSPSTTQAQGNPLTGVSLARPRWNSTCALATGNTALACGGDSTAFSALLLQTPNHPTPTIMSDVNHGSPIKTLINAAISCQLFASGRLECLNLSTTAGAGDGTVQVQRGSPAPVVRAAVIDFAITAAGGCYLKADQSLWCWGVNTNGTVGDGSVTNRALPVFVLNRVKKVLGGGAHVCAQRLDDSLWCWGLNSSGQVGNGTIVNVTSPTKIMSLVSDFSVGNAFSCAIATAKIWCWGRNTDGELGDASGNNRNTPTEVLDVYGIVPISIASGTGHTCVVEASGSAFCWGLNTSGQVGRGNTTNVPIPWRIATTGVQTFALGAAHTCALMTDASVKCFGAASNQQLGTGSTTSVNSISSAATVMTQVQSLSTGHGDATCARSNGLTRCWGVNTGLNAYRAPIGGSLLRTIPQTQ